MYYFTSLPCVTDIRPKHSGEDWDPSVDSRHFTGADRLSFKLYNSRFNPGLNPTFFYSGLLRNILEAYQKRTVIWDNLAGYIRSLSSTTESEVWETYRSPSGGTRLLTKPHPRDELRSIFLVNRQMYTEVAETRERIIRSGQGPSYALQVSIGDGPRPLTCISWLHVPFLHREIDTLDVWFDTSYTYPERKDSALHHNLEVIQRMLPHILICFIRYGPRLLEPQTDASFRFHRSRIPHHSQKHPDYYSIRKIRIHLPAIAIHEGLEPEQRLKSQIGSALDSLSIYHDPEDNDFETGEYLICSSIWLLVIQYSEGFEILRAEKNGSESAKETTRFECNWGAWKESFKARYGYRRWH